MKDYSVEWMSFFKKTSKQTNAHVQGEYKQNVLSNRDFTYLHAAACRLPKNCGIVANLNYLISFDTREELQYLN